MVRGDAVTARFQLVSNAIVERTLPSEAEQLRGKLPAPPAVTAPLFLQRVTQSYWAQPMQEGRTLYLQFNQVTDDADEILAAFGLRMRRELATAAMRTVIVDLRHDNGGNTFTGAVLTGLNVKIPGGGFGSDDVVTDDPLSGTKEFRYNSCTLDSALTRLGRFRPIANGQIANYPIF